MVAALGAYFVKFAGGGAGASPKPPLAHSAWSFLGAFTGIFVLGQLHAHVVVPGIHTPLLVAAFGAMAVLLFSAIKAPVAQPYNTLCGNAIGAVVGVCVVGCMEVFGYDDCFWLTGALSVSLTIVAQEMLDAVHPPGGATALIFALAVPLHKEHFVFVACPAAIGAVIMVAIALIVNNLAAERAYPQWWWPYKPTPSVEGAIPVSASSHEPMLLVDMVKDDSVEQFEETTDTAAENTEVEHCNAVSGACERYLHKFAGAGGESPPKPKLSETFFSFLGSFTGMAVLGLISTYVLGPKFKLNVEVAAFGAMSVLIFSTPKAPLAQPANAIIGNTLGGIIAVLVVECMQLLGLESHTSSCAALSVALTIAVQEQSNTVHPPGGATALLYVITPPMQALHQKFIFAPAFLGTAILVVMGAVMNNLSPGRTYPQRWRFDDSRPVVEVKEDRP